MTPVLVCAASGLLMASGALQRERAGVGELRVEEARTHRWQARP
jgi:hypothetical protein